MIEGVVKRLILLFAVIVGIAVSAASLMKALDVGVGGAFAFVAAGSALSSLFGIWLMVVREEKRGDQPHRPRSAR